MKLAKSTLCEIFIAKPTYARDDVAVGIVHFDAGGFHRAHQAMYVDALLEKGLASRWGICSVGVLAAPSTCMVSPTTGAAGYPLFAELLPQYRDSEATPRLQPVPGIDLPDYRCTLIERFANPGVCDTIARLCYGASDHIGSGCSQWTCEPALRSGCRPPSVVDRSTCTEQLADELVPLARTQRDTPTSFIGNASVLHGLVGQKRFVDDGVAALNSLHRDGASATLEALVREP